MEGSSYSHALNTNSSIRSSTTAGHITEAAFDVASIPTIVVGVCGNSDNSVGVSLQVMEEL